MANEVLYGFVDLQDVFKDRVADVGIEVVRRAIQQSVEEHNRQLNALMRLFATPTTDFKVRYRTPTVARLQALDEHGRARPIQVAGHYDVAFPLQSAGAAWGTDYVSSVKMTVEDANDLTSTLLTADVRWLRDHLLAALFANDGWTFTDDEHGELDVKGLANGDGTLYYVLAGGDEGATDSHYLAQANAISDTDNPFPAIFDELAEHPENGGQVIALISSNLSASVEGLSTFYERDDPNITPGSGTNRLTGTLGVPVPGTVLGYADKVWIIEWRAMPDNTIIAVAADGERALKMRQEPQPELQGFRQVARRDDHPFYESQWLRIAGFGAWNRVGALVYRIGSASYAVPTGYDSPIP